MRRPHSSFTVNESCSESKTYEIISKINKLAKPRSVNNGNAGIIIVEVIPMMSMQGLKPNLSNIRPQNILH